MQAMRVSVIGALKTQEQQITQRPYPNLKLQFACKGHRHKNDDSLITNADRVIVMQKHVGHGIMQKLDKKRAIFAHTIQQVKDTLSNLNDSVFAEDSVSAIAHLREAEQNPKPKVEAVIATPENDTVASNDEGFDFRSLFMAAKEGDVLTFKRPAKVEQRLWENRVQIARSYYKRQKGIHTSSIEWKDGTATVLVEKIEGRPDKIVTKTRGADVPRKTPDAPPTKPTTVVEGKFPKTQHPEATPPSLPSPATEQQQTLPRIASHVGDATDRQFWQEVFLQSMRGSPSSPMAYHAQVADMAFDLMTSKLGR